VTERCEFHLLVVCGGGPPCCLCPGSQTG
jgi:hypothetical protein